MTDRERLIFFIMKANSPLISLARAEELADFLLKNGVVVPPCKVGETLYLVQIDLEGNYFMTSVIAGSKITILSILRAYEEKTVVYMSTDKEETEKALAERQGKNEKP